jgi:hypothetical protein
MTMNTDLMLAVLAVNAYDAGQSVGTTTVIKLHEELTTGFYSVACCYNGDTVIS